jgi:hypothetical protein
MISNLAFAGAKLTLDMAQMKIHVESHFIFYGCGATPEIAHKIIRNIHSQWNAPQAQIKMYGSQLPVRFIISGEVVSVEDALYLARHNNDIEGAKINFVRLEKRTTIGDGRSRAELGGNAGYFEIERHGVRLVDTDDWINTYAHEYGHLLGYQHVGDPQNDGVNPDPKGIMENSLFGVTYQDVVGLNFEKTLGFSH